MFGRRVVRQSSEIKHNEKTLFGDKTYLAHHGIKGQRWGVRNGPPYPLHHLSQYDNEKLTNDTIKKYKSQVPQLSHVRINKNTVGDLYSQNGNPVGMVNVEKKNDGHIWIQALEVFGDNQGKGLGTQLLDHAVNDLNADRLSVNKNNYRAKSLYDKFGFTTYDEDDTMYYMQYGDNEITMSMFGKRVPYVPKYMQGIEEDSDTDISHHGIKGQHWGVRNGPPYPLKQPRTDISDKTYEKINNLYRSMPLADRRMIDPDISDEPQDYFSSPKYYNDNTAFNAVSDHGFVIAEKIPEDKNVDGTHGVEIGIGVTEKGRGVGTGLTKNLVDWFDGQNEYDVMWWPVDENNKGSIRIAEKNGFVKDPLGDNYIYATGQAYRDLGINDSTPDHIYNDLDTFDYGCIINGKRYNETNLDEVDWSQYRTTPVKDFEKTKIGTCWDYTNYQHSKLKEAGINHNTHMLVMDTEDGPVTHTFTTYEDPVNHKQYWLEQALYSERGIHPINSYTDAVDVISRKYDPSSKRAFDVYEFNPDGMDQGLSDQEFFNRATSNDPILQRK